MRLNMSIRENFYEIMKFFDQIFRIKNELEFFERFIDIHRKHTREHTRPKLKRNAANILPTKAVWKVRSFLRLSIMRRRARR